MSVIEKLQPASFRGVSFLVNSETKTGGKKTVTHEYVNSDVRFTEELGKLPPSFTIEAIVHGDNALDQRLSLERVLELSGLGTLVHPVYGSVQVKSTNYSVSSNQRSIGEFRFSINFEKSDANVTISPVISVLSNVTIKSLTARTNLNNAIKKKYVAPDKPTILTAISDTLDEIYEDVFEGASKAVNTVQDKIAEFTQTVNNARRDVLSIVQQPLTLKTSLEDVYQSAIDIVNTPSELADAWMTLIDFGFLDQQGPTNTQIREDKENDLSVLREHTRLNALINLYEAYAATNFTTDTEILAALATLNDAFDRLVNNYDQDITSNISVLAEDSDVRDAINDLRVATKAVLDEKLQNVWRVTTLDSERSSMALIAYRYYGNIDNLEDVTELNPDVNWSNFNEGVTAVAT